MPNMGKYNAEFLAAKSEWTKQPWRRFITVYVWWLQWINNTCHTGSGTPKFQQEAVWGERSFTLTAVWRTDVEKRCLKCKTGNQEEGRKFAWICCVFYDIILYT